MGLDSMSCGSFSGGAGGGEVLRENECSICTAEPFHCSPETVTALLISHVLSGLSCPTLCNPMDCSPPDSSVSGDSPGKNTGVGCHALLQGIFFTQESIGGGGGFFCIAGRFFTSWATREALIGYTPIQNKSFKVWKKKFPWIHLES